MRHKASLQHKGCFTICLDCALKKLAGRHMRGEAIMPYRYVIAGAVTIAVMLAGGLLLETGSGSPSMRYQPAQIVDGKIQPSQFNEN